MAKQAHQNKISRQGNGLTTLEQNTVFDDSLLPPAEELEKLQNISPGIIDWIKERTEIEQDARIKFNQDRVKLAEKDLGSTHLYNFVSLVFAFLIICGAMFFSYILITNNLPIQGSIFAGGTIIISAVYFTKGKNTKTGTKH